MAKLSTDELLDAFKEMTLIELWEFVKTFEDVFDVKAAAPVAVAAAGGAAPADEAGSMLPLSSYPTDRTKRLTSSPAGRRRAIVVIRAATAGGHPQDAVRRL